MPHNKSYPSKKNRAHPIISVMPPQATLISALNNKSADVVLHVKPGRIWESTNMERNKLTNIRVVFVDEKESQSMLTVWDKQKQHYFPLLKEVSVNISEF